MSVLMTLIALAAAGALIGLRFKVSALLAATALLAVGSLAWNGFGFPGHVSVLKFLILAFVLAGAYIIGVFLSVRWKQTAE